MRLVELIKNADSLTVIGSLEKEIKDIVFNSKLAAVNSLFVALKSREDNGLAYISEAIAQGAVAILTDEIPPLNCNGITYLKASDVRKAAAILTATFYQYPAKKLNLIGITGTNGKTTTSYLIASILRQSQKKTGIIGTIQYQCGNKAVLAALTTPESLELQMLFKKMVLEGISDVVMEVSSHSLFYKRVAECQFRLAIFTNLSQDHLDFHKDMETYFECKKKLFTHYLANNGYAIINLDDPYGKRLSKEINVSYLTYGLSPLADIWAENPLFSLNGTKATIHTKKGCFPIFSPLIGKPNLYNLLAAIGTAIVMDLPLDKIKVGIEEVQSVCGRLERFSRNGIEVFVDYAHSPAALEQTLKTLRPLCQGKLITVFGCGGNRDRGKRPLMGKVVSELSNMVIITDDNPRYEPSRQIIQDIEVGIKKGISYWVIPQRKQAIHIAIKYAQRNDIVFIAGKGHENYQLIGGEKYYLSDRKEVEKALRDK
jgi:UDP-N-acetylmuramoyl-L-alanyl-D-glutamate--2,6-diaminopimelate ligase